MDDPILDNLIVCSIMRAKDIFLQKKILTNPIKTDGPENHLIKRLALLQWEAF